LICLWILSVSVLLQSPSATASAPLTNVPSLWCSYNSDRNLKNLNAGWLDNIPRLQQYQYQYRRRHQIESQRQTKLFSFLLLPRGGCIFQSNNGRKTVTRNNPPQPQKYVPSAMTLGDIESSFPTSADGQDEHEATINQQQKPTRNQVCLQGIRPIIAATIVPLQQHGYHWYRRHPVLSQITAACVVIFIAWHIPNAPIYYYNSIMNNYFVCQQSNITLQYGKFLSLLLSAISHIDVWHLLYNLMALFSLGPSVQRIIEQNVPSTLTYRKAAVKSQIVSSLSAPMMMWLLVIGAALSGSTSYLVWNSMCGVIGAGCLGLSAVTMSFLSIYASAYPNNILQFRIGGIIPVRLPAEQLILFAYVGSIVGCILPILFKSRRIDNISHSGHLGGLIFGAIFYDLIIVNRSPHQLPLSRYIIGLWQRMKVQK
jgi:membrane associated rhomboid family serine protease